MLLVQFLANAYLWGPRICLTNHNRLDRGSNIRFDEIAPTQPAKPLSPEQARLTSMKDRVKRDQEAVKAERARKKLRLGNSS